jgi:hypothetical protein
MGIASGTAVFDMGIFGRFLGAAWLSASATGAHAQSVWNTTLWTSASKAANLSSMAASDSVMVAVGWRSEDSTGIIITSRDGDTWTPQTSGTKSFLHSVAWTGSRFVAVGGPTDKVSGSTTILTSPDGTAWTPHDVGMTNVLFSVEWTGSQLVAVGGLPRNDSGSAIILTSPDGETWTARESGVSGEGELLGDVAWTGSRFVAVGYPGIVLTSPDGVTWTSRESGTAQNLPSLAWTGGRLVAVGDSGTILTSPDGETWTPRSSGTRNYLTSVAWTGSQLVSVGVKGDLLTSKDGIAWTNDNFMTPTQPFKVIWIRKNLITLFVVANYFLVSQDDPTRTASSPRAAKDVTLRVTHDRLFASLPGNPGAARAVVLDPAGHEVSRASAAGRLGELSLPLSGLPRGMYLFRAEAAGRRYARSFALVP